MGRCLNCGAENEGGSKFCGSCGARLIASCPSCGEALGGAARYCPNCGADLVAAVRRPSGGSPQALGPAGDAAGGVLPSAGIGPEAARRYGFIAVDAALVLLFTAAPWLRIGLYVYYEDFTLLELASSFNRIGDFIGGGSGTTLKLLAAMAMVCLVVSLLCLAADIYYRVSGLGRGGSSYSIVCAVSVLLVLSFVLVNLSVSASANGGGQSYAAEGLSDIVSMRFGAYTSAIVSGIAHYLQRSH